MLKIKSRFFSSIFISATLLGAVIPLASCGQTPQEFDPISKIGQATLTKKAQTQVALDKLVTEIDRDDTNTGTANARIISDHIIAVNEVMTILQTTWQKDVEVHTALINLQNLTPGTLTFETQPNPNTGTTTWNLTTKLIWTSQDSSIIVTSANPLSFFFQQPLPIDPVQKALDSLVTALNDSANIKYITITGTTTHFTDKNGLFSAINTIWIDPAPVNPIKTLLDGLNTLSAGTWTISSEPQSYASGVVSFSTKIKWVPTTGTAFTSTANVQFNVTNPQTSAEKVQDSLNAFATILKVQTTALELTLGTQVVTATTQAQFFDYWLTAAKAANTDVNAAYTAFNTAVSTILPGTLSFSTPPLQTDFGKDSWTFSSTLTYTPTAAPSTPIISTSSMNFDITNKQPKSEILLNAVVTEIDKDASIKTFDSQYHITDFDQLNSVIENKVRTNATVKVAIDALLLAFPNSYLAINETDAGNLNWNAPTLSFSAKIDFVKKDGSDLIESTNKIAFAITNPTPTDPEQELVSSFVMGLLDNPEDTIGTAATPLAVGNKITDVNSLWTFLKSKWNDSSNPVNKQWQALSNGTDGFNVVFKTAPTTFTGSDLNFSTIIDFSWTTPTAKTISSESISFYIRNVDAKQDILDNIISEINAEDTLHGTSTSRLQSSFTSAQEAWTYISGLWNADAPIKQLIDSLGTGTLSLTTAISNFETGDSDLSTTLTFTPSVAPVTPIVSTSSVHFYFHNYRSAQVQTKLDDLVTAVNADDTAKGTTATPIAFVNHATDYSMAMQEFQTVWTTKTAVKAKLDALTTLSSGTFTFATTTGLDFGSLTNQTYTTKLIFTPQNEPALTSAATITFVIKNQKPPATTQEINQANTLSTAFTTAHNSAANGLDLSADTGVNTNDAVTPVNISKRVATVLDGLITADPTSYALLGTGTTVLMTRVPISSGDANKHDATATDQVNAAILFIAKSGNLLAKVNVQFFLKVHNILSVASLGNGEDGLIGFDKYELGGIGDTHGLEFSMKSTENTLSGFLTAQNTKIQQTLSAKWANTQMKYLIGYQIIYIFATAGILDYSTNFPITAGKYPATGKQDMQGLLFWPGDDMTNRSLAFLDVNLPQYTGGWAKGIFTISIV